MARDRQSGPAQDNSEDSQAAGGGPFGMAGQGYGDLAARLLDNGFEPLPILPGTKRPAPSRWSSVSIDEVTVAGWSARHPAAGIGLRTGTLAAIDIDIEDPDLAHVVAAMFEDRLGSTLVRVGRWPRRLMIYRTAAPFAKMRAGPVEVLGRGQQFVAFGIHPGTGQPYDWVSGESPCDVQLADLPRLDREMLAQALAEATALFGLEPAPRPDRIEAGRSPGPGSGWTRDERGLIVDGRDAWLSAIAFHAVQDARDLGAQLVAGSLAIRVWDRFCATTDLSRPRQASGDPWGLADARRKVMDKLRLAAAGRLPERGVPVTPAAPLGELLPVEQARARLGDAIDKALASATAWWAGDRRGERPAIGIRATVGLGKSAASRHRIVAWQQEMRAMGLPDRVLVVTPSHVLAEEAASGWRAVADVPVAVLRGYEGRDPVSGAPMCRDIEMVRLALHEGLGIGRSVCRSSSTWVCQHFAACPKQLNRREVAAAGIVLAPYDVLYTGPAAGSDPFGLMVVDEGCWQRAIDDVVIPPLEELPNVNIGAGLRSDDADAAARMADLAALRRRATAALAVNGPGAVVASAISATGLTAEDCLVATRLEESCLREARIYPGMKPRARRQARQTVRQNEIARRMMALWRALAAILRGEAGAPLLRVATPETRSGQHRIVLHGRHAVVPQLAGVPVLHLDATLREDLAGRILPGLEVIRIDAEAPQHLTLIAGRFGKTSLCPSAGLAPEEQQRRRNRLRDVVDHVRWQARRVAPGKVLVITYMAIEPMFRGIPGVQVAHFNAIAGLDQFRDVALLIVLGRPLPSSPELELLCASLFGQLPGGRYHPLLQAVHMRDGGRAVLRRLAHPDREAELLRAAICDDEVIQAIGRGRGVNRTAADPLEVQVLADVALPLVHDRVLAWEAVVSDIVQRMLLAGLAVDSPSDAAALHPGLFSSPNEAKLAFDRAGFKGHSHISTIYKEMTLKSAAYRRPGRGRSWQRAWWIDGTEDEARQSLEAGLGPLHGWEGE